MNKAFFRKIQFLSNIAIIVIAICLVVAVIRLFIFSAPTKENLRHASIGNSPNFIGETIPLENINWSENKRTVVLYLSNSCHFCTSSAPFYQQLVAKSSGKDIKLIAVLPQSVDEGEEYLRKLDVKIDDVYQNQLSSIGVRGTPTLLLVDENGTIINFWRGKLTKEKESEVLNTLGSI